MVKRLYNPLIARFAVVAALLATVLVAPAVFAQDTALPYPENGTDPVATFTADDQDDDLIVWDLGGPDADLFTIDGGVLAFKESPDYEDPQSESVGTVADRNVHNITIEATGGELEVAVTVTNVDEDGVVSFTGYGRFQPQVGRGLVAELDDDDGGETDEVWQWARSADGETWEDIMGATSQSRMPVADDVGSYLRASVTYTDIFDSGKTASEVTPNAVEARTVSNAAPSFLGQDETTGAQAESPNEIIVTRKVAENTVAGTNIGKPVSASDTDNDVLVYSLGGEVTIGSDQVDATDLFNISSSSGQLKAKAKLNFEGLTASPSTNPTSNLYPVMVTATDPSGAPTPQLVTIELTDVNEAPAFEEGDDTPTVLNVVEGTTGTEALRVGETGTTVLATNAYDANDEDADQDLGGDATDADDETDATLSLSGADKKYFEITNAGALTIIDDDTTTTDADESHTPDFEEKSSYSIAIVAASGEGDRLLRTSLDVTVHVIDAEDDGEVILSQREPQEGQTVIATVEDDDGGVIITEWAWATQAANVDGDGDFESCPLATVGSWDPVANVSSAAYSPSTEDVGDCLRATATYTDDIENAADDDDEMVSEVSERSVQMSNPANAAPKFEDQDLVTVGDQSDEATRSVAENQDAGETVGNPLTATDTDLLLYNLSGPDADNFEVDDNGQITTAEKLDFEAQPTHTVVLNAMDPSGAVDSILVTINVTDEDDAATITPVTGPVEPEEPENNAPEFAAATAARSVAENEAAGTNVGAPVTATDADNDDLTYTLTGSTYFAIDDSGQITTTMMLDHEDMASHEVTVTAEDGNGGSDSITVTITVTNVGLANAYDTNDSGAIDKEEVLAAVDAYFDDTLSKADVLAIVDLYFG